MCTRLKNLSTLWYFKQRTSTALQTLKFYSTARALKILDRALPFEELTVDITKFKISTIIALREINTAYYAYCPLKAKTDHCENCSFFNGLGVDITSVLSRAIFDDKFLNYFISNSVTRRITFNCHRHISPQFNASAKTSFFSQHKLLAEIASPTPTLRIYCWIPPQTTLEQARALYENQTVKMQFQLISLADGYKVMVGTFSDSKSQIPIHMRELQLLLLRYMDATTGAQAVDIFKHNLRLTRGQLTALNIKYIDKLLRELEWMGYVSKTNGMFYRRRKLGNALKIA